MQPSDLPYLETFARAAELNNFTAAAQELDLTQAAVSQRIQALERELKVSLFSRSGGRLELTEAGRTLYDYAHRIRALHQEARERVGGQKPKGLGDLLLGASSIPGEHILPDLLASYSKQYPNVRIRVTVLDTQAVLTLVEQGKVHLGLVGGKDEYPDLEFRPIASDQMLLLVGPAHPWHKRRSVSVDELRGEPLVLREAGSGSRWCFEQALKQVGLSLGDFKVAMELGSNGAVKLAVRNGVGVGILSQHSVRNELATGELHALQVRTLPLERDIFLVWHRRRILPPPARLFLQFLESCRKTIA